MKPNIHKSVILMAVFYIYQMANPNAHAQHEDIDPDVENFQTLETYYRNAGLDFVVVDDPSSSDPQKWFKTDVEKFNNYSQKADFIRAKRKDYSSYQFESKTQTHDLPYYVMKSWGVLNHPPIRDGIENTEAVFSDFAPLNYSKIESKFFDPEFQTSIDYMSQTEMTAGNSLRLLPNNESYREKLRLIGDAKKSLLVNIMSFQCDESSIELVNAMGERKKAGVDVRVILEAFHNFSGNAKCAKEMRKQGIEVLDFSDTVETLLKSGVNHSKYWIRDGVEAIVGGQNIHDGSNLSTGTNFRNRDTDVLIKSGPAVTDLMAVFVDVWGKNQKKDNTSVNTYKTFVKNQLKVEKNNSVRGHDHYRDWLSSPESRMKGVCRVVSQRGGADPINIADVYLKYIDASTEHILIESPGITFNKKKVNSKRRNELVIESLRNRAKQGLNVDFLTNGIGGGMGEFSDMVNDLEEKTSSNLLDHLFNWFDSTLAKISIGGARKNLLDLEKGANIRVHQYFNYLHSKAWMFDRIASSIGSWNLDVMSAEKNFETTMICLDESLSREVEGQFAKDFANAVPLVSKNGK